jgi:hypothetical protein
MPPRNFADPQYKAWRAAVRKRDRHKCKKCGSRKRLHAHHIKPWAEFPQLRHVVSNGISLCRACHRRMSQREHEFASLCYALLAAPDALYLRILGRLDGEDKKPT